MAPRKQVAHSIKVKTAIQASQLLNRLISFANGECDMSSAQVQAAKIVIGKVIPDLRSVEHTGDPDKPIKHLAEIIYKTI